ncbi:hypothetical protein [Methylomonas albis]|nr:hypothetical protein [Methylomonas albis]
MAKFCWVFREALKIAIRTAWRERRLWYSNRLSVRAEPVEA